jgi:hypothetical protein
MSGTERCRRGGEAYRKVRLGNLRQLFRSRYGSVFPNDDAGREDLYELLLPISIGPHTDRKIPNTIELWAPWMSETEAAELIERINRTPIWQRMPSDRELGKRQRVTNRIREHWRLRTIYPIDMTPEQMAEQRKAKHRDRMRRLRLRRRQQRATATREQWLAQNTASRNKP